MASKIGQYLQSLNPFSRGPVVDVKKNLAGMISPVQLQRIRTDVLAYREAIIEAENAWYPQRVKMQRMFNDTGLNGHVSACVERRKDLTMLRKFEVVNGGDNADSVFFDVIDSNGQKILTPKKWVNDFISYSLDALFYGYSLLALGDVEGDAFKKISTIKRWNVSPDRRNVTTFVYSISGKCFDDKDVAPWHVYVDTNNDIGASPCGYGIFYKVAIYEIFLRNLLGFNGDFLEMYAQPYRVGKTTKTNETERAEFAETLRLMGSAGWAVMDPEDEISFLETALGGTGYKGYDNLELRCEKKISKLVLGHADAMDSIPGKLGNSGEKSPAQVALDDKQSKDGAFIENIINTQLIPRLVELGFNISPETKVFFKNDAEQAEIRNNEDTSNAATADIAYKMKQAGLEMDAKYFQDRTGIPTTKVIVPPPATKEFKAQPFSESVKNKLEKIYGK